MTCEEFLQVRLDDGGVGRLAEDLQQVVVSDEVEAWKRRAFFLRRTHTTMTSRQPACVLHCFRGTACVCTLYLQKLIERLLAALQLIQDGDQRVSDACPRAQQRYSVVPLDVRHDRPARRQQVFTAPTFTPVNLVSAKN